MISVNELRSGTVFEHNGQVLKVLSYEHIKMGRGSATIKVRVKNVKSGATTEKSFINGEKVNDIQIVKKELQYLYRDDEFAYFMDPRTFEQINVSLKLIEDSYRYLKEGEKYSINFLENEPLDLNLPPKMEFRIAETEEAVKGNSVTNIFKDAVLENGLKVRVPLFIKENDRILIDTRTNTYSEKA